MKKFFSVFLMVFALMSLLPTQASDSSQQGQHHDPMSVIISKGK